MRHLKDLVTAFPNLVTLLRMALVPVLVLFMSRKWHWAALGLFLFLAWTDWLDGFLARKFNQVTPIGKVLDPLADKVLIWVTVWSFELLENAFYWVLMLFVVDMTLALFGGIAYWLLAGGIDSRVVGANWAGKCKFGFQVVFIASVFLFDRGFSFDFGFIKDTFLLLFILPSFALFAAIVFAWMSLIGHIVSFFAARKTSQKAA